jgi:pseudaminic acid synthase
MMIIDDRLIGGGHPPYIIAEVSANHNGDIQQALDTITMAKEMGADAVKIQTYTPETMTIECDNDDFKVLGGLWDGYSLFELYKWAQTPFEWHEQLFQHAKTIGITLFSTPFDESAVDLLDSLESPAYKIASFEATDLPLIDYVSRKQKPMIVSTGLANLEEIEDVVSTIKQAGNNELALLHCISSYPAPVNESNLKTILDMQARFCVLIGLSDHSKGVDVAIAAVALGACIIEKHVTLDRNNGSPDAEFSLEPNEFKELCERSYDTWLSLGVASYDRKPAEESSMKFRRSLYFVKSIAKGEVITDKHVRRIRPGYGLAPKHINNVIGKNAARDISRGESVQWSSLHE